MIAEVTEDSPLTLEQQVCFMLTVASREVVSLYRPLLEPLGLTHPQYLVMISLWGTSEARSFRQLTRLLRLEAPTLSPLLKRLEHAGLVERQRDPADERSVLVRLTDRGRQLRVRAADVPAAIFDRLGMSVRELESLQDILSGVVAHARTQHDQVASDPPEDPTDGTADVGPR